MLIAWLAVTAALGFSRASPVPESEEEEDHGPRRFQPFASDWRGWGNISHMIVFGDSYTTTGFQSSGAQPSEMNPLGNPPYPGHTSSNGPNWIDFLTTTWNRSFIETVNLAVGGAFVVTEEIIPSTSSSVKQQIDEIYVPEYASQPGFFSWQPFDTLFAVWIGINDINAAYRWANASETFSRSIAEYAALMDQLYQTGARNFLLLNVPPTDRAPLSLKSGASAVNTIKSDIASWNSHVSSIAQNLSASYSDVTTFVVDTNAIFSRVLDNPCVYAETCAYKDTTGYCENYHDGTPSWYSKYDNCTYSVDEYFWLNDLHPTFRVHNATAEEIVKQLDSHGVSKGVQEERRLLQTIGNE